MNEIYSTERAPLDGLPAIYLAGPTRRTTGTGLEFRLGWRNEALEELLHRNFKGTVYVPEWRDEIKPPDWTYQLQVSWELAAMQLATCILFWIPRDLKTLPAFTTNTEAGEWLSSGKVVFGSPPEAPKNRYLQERCRLLDIPWHSTLAQTVQAALDKVKGCCAT